MADIAPIRGILYNPARVEGSKVLSPPYDVIDEDDRRALEALDPHNSVRLILPRGDGAQKYENAAKLFRAWLSDGVLRRDAAPAVYRYHQVFTSPEIGDAPAVRKGFVAGVRLADFSEGVVKPHERTLKGPKIDRLNLMRACKAHFSQIFTLFSDPERATDRLFEAAEARAPALEGTTADGTTHRLWRVDDREVLRALRSFFTDRSLYIADGHHRYETMVALRGELREAAGGALPANSAGEFGTLFLANMDDPGLVVFPIHRLVHSLASFDLADLVARARGYFAVETVTRAAADASRLRDVIAERAGRGATFAAVVPGSDDAVVFTLKGTARDAGLEGHPSVLALDVTVLHELVLERLLGIDRKALEEQTHVTYVKDTRKCLDKIRGGAGQVAFFMHPTRVEQVRDVADAGETMPQKSTYFFPKIASGLVMSSVDPAETLELP